MPGARSMTWYQAASVTLRTARDRGEEKEDPGMAGRAVKASADKQKHLWAQGESRHKACESWMGMVTGKTEH